jgi:hypothetical protein
MAEARDRSAVRSFRDLVAWQKAMVVAETVYRMTVDFPSEEKYGLTSQMRRAAVSIVSNIAEGHSRHTRGDSFSSSGTPEDHTRNLKCNRFSQSNWDLSVPIETNNSHNNFKNSGDC